MKLLSLHTKYYLWYIWRHRICWWQMCSECRHPAWWHYWAEKVYCWNRDASGICDCGYHIGR